MSRSSNSTSSSGRGGASFLSLPANQQQAFALPFPAKAGASEDAWVHIRPALRDPMQPSKKVHDSGVTMLSAASSKQSSRSNSTTSSAAPEPSIAEEWEVVYPDE